MPAIHFTSTEPVNIPPRQRAKRFQVDLPGTVQIGKQVYPVTVSDVSSSGALISLRAAVAIAHSAEVVLTIRGFGALPARVARIEHWSWGVSFVNPQQYRFRLIGWLQQDVSY